MVVVFDPLVSVMVPLWAPGDNPATTWELITAESVMGVKLVACALVDSQLPSELVVTVNCTVPLLLVTLNPGEPCTWPPLWKVNCRLFGLAVSGPVFPPPPPDDP